MALFARSSIAFVFSTLLQVAVLGCGGEETPATGSTTGTTGETTTTTATTTGAGGADTTSSTSSTGGGSSTSSGSNPSSGGGTSGVGGAGGAGGAGSTGSATSSGTGGIVVQDPGTDGDGDYTIGPTYPVAPETLVTAGVPVGTINKFTLTSSVIFPGVTGPYPRDVAVYVPQQYVAGVEAPFLVVQDGSTYLTRVATVLDNLISQKKLPVMIAVFVNPGPGNGPGSERSFEYDTLSDDYVSFIETEILPKIKADYNLTLTDNPEGRAAMGGSSGGAAAFTMGWRRPDLYRRVLTYSGSFVDLHPDAQNPHGAADYWMSYLGAASQKPLRVFLEVGDMDLTSVQYGNWKKSNIAMAMALAGKGYHYRFLSATNAGHIDKAVIASTLPETLLWLWRGYPIN